MKKRTWLIILISLLMAACMGAFVACTPIEDDIERYTVTVTGGTGGGVYEKGAECTVRAILEEGETFLRWLDGEGEEVSTDNPYTFTVTKNVSLTAVTEQSAEETVTVTVKGGGVITGTNNTSVTVALGESVSVSVPQTDDFIFSHWEIDGKKVSEENPYVFTPEKDTEIVAVGENLYLIIVEGGTLADGSTRKIFHEGEECTLTVGTIPEGQSFIYWYVINDDGEEEVVSRDEVYTFIVTSTERYYAKISVSYTVTVVNGIIVGEESDSVLVPEGGSVTVEANEPPAGMFFREWTVDGERVSTSARFTYTNVTKDITIEAVFSGYLGQLETPQMENNEMFRVGAKSPADAYRPIELDRGSKGTAFVNHVDYVVFYIYTSTTADKNDYVGKFIFDNGAGWRIASETGETLLLLEGNPANFWIETKTQPSGNDYTKSDLFAAFRAAIGDKYNARTGYYLAAQACTNEAEYENSEISVIGPQKFIEDNVPGYTVTVKGGVITGTEDTTKLVYADETVSVTATGEGEFLYWLVNGVQGSAENPYVFTPTRDTTLEAVYRETVHIKVVGGTIGDGPETETDIAAGEQLTIKANEPEEGYTFAYWYTQGADGAEEILSYDETYTFTVASAMTIYAKFNDKIIVTVSYGDDDNVTHNVPYGGSLTITLDLEKVPSGKGFVEWRINGASVGTAFTYVLTNVTESVTVEAVFGDLVYLTTPQMDSNEMFRVGAKSQEGAYKPLEFDRGTSGTAFKAHVDYVMFYIYTSTSADKNDYVGKFVLINKDGSYKLTTESGEILLNLEGPAGNMWVETATQPSGNQYSKSDLFAAFRKAIGEKYNARTGYYLAAQACVSEVGYVYANSEISVIGPQVFIEDNTPSYTITVVGGVFTGTDETTKLYYADETVSVTATGEKFLFWAVDGQEVSKENPYTFTPDKNMTIEAVYDNTVHIKVVGGTIGDEEETEGNYAAGSQIVLKANPAGENQVFGYWYTLVNGDEENIVSRTEEFTLTVTGEETYYVKYLNIYTVTVDYGNDVVETYQVTEGGTLTIKLNLEKIPEGKGFVEWKVEGNSVGTSMTYELTNVTANVTVVAVFDDLQPLATPVMDHNEMFYPEKEDGSYNPIAFDRQQPNGTAFQAHVDHIMFYIYTSTEANEKDFVGRIVLDNKDGWRLATVEGKTLIWLEGNKGGLWVQSKTQPSGGGYNRSHLFAAFAEVIGDKYDPTQAYYLAAQACIGESDFGYIYADSAISVIGPKPFIQVEGELTKLATPDMDANQMLRFSANNPTKTIELDRGSSSPFNNGANYVMFYIYISTDAAKDAYVGRFILDNNGGWRLATVEGVKLMDIKGRATDLYQDDNGVSKLFELLRTVIQDYNAATRYYLAAQACANEGTNYSNSEISVIGPTAFVENASGEVTKLATPNADLMFKHNPEYTTLEFDRDGNSPFNNNASHVVFYIYTSTSVSDKESECVGKFILDNKGVSSGGSYTSLFRIATMEGETLLALEGTVGNLWLSTRPQSLGSTIKSALFAAFKQVIGESYSATQNYYLAVQAIGRAGITEDSDISAIGTTAFIEDATGAAAGVAAEEIPFKKEEL